MTFRPTLSEIALAVIAACVVWALIHGWGQMWRGAYSASSAQNVSFTTWQVESDRRGQDEDTPEGGGVRVPRRPVAPRNTSGAALDLPRAADPAPTFGYVIS